MLTPKNKTHRDRSNQRDYDWEKFSMYIDETFGEYLKQEPKARARATVLRREPANYVANIRYPEAMGDGLRNGGGRTQGDFIRRVGEPMKKVVRVKLEPDQVRNERGKHTLMDLKKLGSRINGGSRFLNGKTQPVRIIRESYVMPSNERQSEVVYRNYGSNNYLSQQGQGNLPKYQNRPKSLLDMKQNTRNSVYINSVYR